MTCPFLYSGGPNAERPTGPATLQILGDKQMPWQRKSANQFSYYEYYF
tara:strand:+ start:414 stop:557 length:144 start_codon:yes stop_codon:yes gene_type:complete